MSVNDHIGNLISSLKNASVRGIEEVTLPWTKSVEAVAQVLKDSKFIESLSSSKGAKKTISIKLKYDEAGPAITGSRRISRPGVRIYAPMGKLPKSSGGIGVVVISTSKGILSAKEAHKLHLGGEVLCEIW